LKISQSLIGEDPGRIGISADDVSPAFLAWKRSRALHISGIDIALWDIAGKLRGVPCHQLWGGPVQTIRTYCHLGR
jgi:galactonate dehydratase